ncbi:FAD/NAD(P)-binding domain-containing protein [Exidia glandulosa HHB12029]|uniref:FAD/NAD(P)-binding domain-containing protein n=1 Tax=Exidia glandulosa HHB12029 TaxID=1314781 RepID=A0A166BKD4_EXIGL|nr:FAD/NAD(P)-binding domain-containing protein [Exidia glandulosa HHB12029]
MLSKVPVVVAFSVGLAAAAQLPLGGNDGPYHHFESQIKRVAVIGAGPAGLQHAAVLRENGFEVRLFERAPGPRGNWLSTSELPVSADFPDRRIEDGAYVPDIPHKLPHSHVYHTGDDGLSLNVRWREQWNPSPVWEHLTSNSPSSITKLPEVDYPPDHTWTLSNQEIRRHVRQYAAYKGLLADDEEARNITSYSTRVERLQKPEDSSRWTLTLRRLRWHGAAAICADWWTEEFDAVLVATGDYDSTHTPNIPGVPEWAERFPTHVFHSREYRHPSSLQGNDVLIIGASVSASEISRDIAPHVRSFSVSVRDRERSSAYDQRNIRRFAANITRIPEIRRFYPVDDSTSVRDAKLELINGTIISGFDQIIFATGFRRSNPFLAGFHNSTIKGDENPDVDVAPIITDGTHIRSVHWTGHYIPDPTLAFTAGRPWTVGTLAALAVARTWSGKARLPNLQKRWEQYNGPQRNTFFSGLFGSLGHQAYHRQLIVWLNNEALELGGRLVDQFPLRKREEFVYYANLEWTENYVTSANFSRYDDTPRSEWGKEEKTLATDLHIDW